jgi:hypothetical protein
MRPEGAHPPEFPRQTRLQRDHQRRIGMIRPIRRLGRNLPASIRRNSAERARSGADSQSRAGPRSSLDGPSTDPCARVWRETGRTRATPGRATRRTTAFTRRSGVARNGAENIF